MIQSGINQMIQLGTLASAYRQKEKESVEMRSYERIKSLMEKGYAVTGYSNQYLDPVNPLSPFRTDGSISRTINNVKSKEVKQLLQELPHELSSKSEYSYALKDDIPEDITRKRERFATKSNEAMQRAVQKQMTAEAERQKAYQNAKNKVNARSISERIKSYFKDATKGGV